MRPSLALRKVVSALIVCSFLLGTAPAGSAQQPPPTVTGSATLGGGSCSGQKCTFKITFPPAGGAVIGEGRWEGNVEGTPALATISMTGSFAGGDGASASGTFVSTLGDGIPDSTGSMTWRGSWHGNFYADGTGTGILDYETVYAPATSPEVMECKVSDTTWEVAYSASDWQTALNPAPIVTAEYIYNTYGITVEDSFGDGAYARKVWSDQELVLLNEVLKELPAVFRDKLALGSLVRNAVGIDEDGHPDPDVYGQYSPCERTAAGQPCDPEKDSVIRIFDLTLTAGRFANDPDGYKSFKATLIHELTHAFQRQADGSASAGDPLKRNASGYVSPLMQNYNDATRPVTDMNDPRFRAGNGWGVRPDGSWVLTSAPGDSAPTDYAATNPKEDMADSVRLYVQDPQKLLAASPKRYNFIRDFIFGGVEYDDGKQK